MPMFAIKIFFRISEMTFPKLVFFKHVVLKIESPNEFISTINFPERDREKV